jgi:hypothetical protein
MLSRNAISLPETNKCGHIHLVPKAYRACVQIEVASTPICSNLLRNSVDSASGMFRPGKPHVSDSEEVTGDMIMTVSHLDRALFDVMSAHGDENINGGFLNSWGSILERSGDGKMAMADSWL